MSETSGQTKIQQIEDLLRRGLDAYGNDEFDVAVSCWKKVLALDPGNAEALDYIESAGRDDEATGSDVPSDAQSDVITMALALLGDEEGERALQALAGATEQSLEIETARELVRSQLVSRYSLEIGPTDLPRPSTAKVEPGATLPPDAGFLLSLIDGETRVADLISLSGMDRFDTLHALRGLVAGGLVELD